MMLNAALPQMLRALRTAKQHEEELSQTYQTLHPDQVVECLLMKDLCDLYLSISTTYSSTGDGLLVVSLHYSHYQFESIWHARARSLELR